MKNSKTYVVNIHHHGAARQASGTLQELVEYFGYTLERGHSWNRKLARYPKTAKSLVSTLNKCISETCNHYDPDWYDLAS